MRQRLTEWNEAPPSEDVVEQMLVLAERFKQETGGDLDESAMQAVAETTGAPIEYVRLAVKLRYEKQEDSLLSKVRAQFLTFTPDTRRHVASGFFATIIAFLTILEAKVTTYTNAFNGSEYGIFSMIGILLMVAAVYNAAVARTSRVAAISGAILGGGLMMMRSVFAGILVVPLKVEPLLLIPATIFGALCGLGIQRLIDSNRKRLGMRDPIQERQALLQQLHDLRDRLHSGEQALTFLSVDIAGSTRMKDAADPLAVEFTFNEYHQFVERVVQRHGGRVHSTAGDGVTAAFDQPQAAFNAAKNLQTGLIELNMMRNKIGVPITLRCGIHSGTVVAPDAGDVTTLNFSQVIDIAAHLQKVAPVGGIAVSSASAAQIAGGMNGVGTERVEVEGATAAVWRPKSVVAIAAHVPTPPPMPQGA